MPEVTRHKALRQSLVARSFAALLLVAFLSASTAAEASQLSFIGVGNYSDPVSKNLSPGGNVYHGKTSFGGGALLEFSLIPWLGLETGAILLQRKFGDADGHTLRSTVAQIPVALRVWLGFNFSFGFGVYAAPALGRIRDRGEEMDYSLYHLKTFDYGGLGSVRWDFGGPAFFGFFVEGRYNFGMANVTTEASPADVRHRDLQTILGLRVGG